MARKVVVLGANFGGLTAALSLKKDLGNDVDVKVVSDRDYFLFNPSLIWLPFGSRDTNDVSFKVKPTFENGEVDFIESAAIEIHPDTNKVDLANGNTLEFDYLVIATGTRNKPEHVKGLKENSNTITTLGDAIETGEA